MSEFSPRVGIAEAQTPLFSRYTGPLALAAGILFVVGQVVWWPFDQRQNVATARNPVFHAGSAVYLAGFCVLMFALIAAHGLQARQAGRFGTVGVSVAIVGTMFLAGDLWFEAFAVPWLADGPEPQVIRSQPSSLLALGAISSYLLFAAGWVLFGIACLRARVFPVAISVAIVIGGIAGFSALLAPFGIPLGVAVAALGIWTMRQARHAA
jgi:hypothetical protein